MIIVLDKSKDNNYLNQIKDKLNSLNLKISEVNTQSHSYIVAIGNYNFDIREVGHLPGVIDVFKVSDPYKLVSRKWKTERTKIDLGDNVILGDSLQFMCGPCSIENVQQLEAVASFLQSQNVQIIRGGAFKPRSSPYSFQGLGLEGLKIIKEVAMKYKLKVISEVMDISQIDIMHEYIDIFQVGTRNSQNFPLFQELGKVEKPVLIKRGMSGTLEELLQAAEYVFAKGNEKIILCERGIRTFEKSYRNVLDINAIPVLKDKSHLPVIVDPSHGIGIRKYIEAVTLAGVVAGADGVLMEIHETPELAFSDGDQTVNFEEARNIITKAKALVTSLNH